VKGLVCHIMRVRQKGKDDLPVGETATEPTMTRSIVTAESMSTGSLRSITPWRVTVVRSQRFVCFSDRFSLLSTWLDMPGVGTYRVLPTCDQSPNSGKCTEYLSYVFTVADFDNKSLNSSLQTLTVLPLLSDGGHRDRHPVYKNLL